MKENIRCAPGIAFVLIGSYVQDEKPLLDVLARRPSSLGEHE